MSDRFNDWSSAQTTASDSLSSACACIGPRNGEPYCRCKMRHLMVWNGRYVQDMGPVHPVASPARPSWTPTVAGCVCPPGAEATCKGMLCPRHSIGPAMGGVRP